MLPLALPTLSSHCGWHHWTPNSTAYEVNDAWLLLLYYCCWRRLTGRTSVTLLCFSCRGTERRNTETPDSLGGGGVPCLYPGSSGYSSQRGRGSRCWTAQYMSAIYTNLYFKVFSNTQNTSVLLHEDSLIYFVMIHEDSWFFSWVYLVILLEIKTVPGI